MKFSRTILLASTALLCGACTSHTLETTVKMGGSQSFGSSCKYNNEYYTSVDYTFSAVDDGYTLKPEYFSIKSDGETFKGLNFITKMQDATVVATVASSIKLTTSVTVMYDGKLSYETKDQIGTINSTTNIKPNVKTDITFKW